MFHDKLDDRIHRIEDLHDAIDAVEVSDIIRAGKYDIARTLIDAARLGGIERASRITRAALLGMSYNAETPIIEIDAAMDSHGTRISTRTEEVADDEGPWPIEHLLDVHGEVWEEIPAGADILVRLKTSATEEVHRQAEASRIIEAIEMIADDSKPLGTPMEIHIIIDNAPTHPEGE